MFFPEIRRRMPAIFPLNRRIVEVNKGSGTVKIRFSIRELRLLLFWTLYLYKLWLKKTETLILGRLVNLFKKSTKLGFLEEVAVQGLDKRHKPVLTELLGNRKCYKNSNTRLCHLLFVAIVQVAQFCITILVGYSAQQRLSRTLVSI